MDQETVRRARAWRSARLRAICDLIEPWEHGTIARASGYPTYYNYNLVRVEDEGPVTFEALVALADRALEGLSHRRIDLDSAALADRLRPSFAAAGWRTARILWLRHEGGLLDGPEIAVEPVPYDAAHELRVSWHGEDLPDVAAGPDFYRAAREVAMALGARVLAVLEDGVAVAYVQLEGDDQGIEISDVYVHPDHRGRGLGTAVTRAAIRQAGRPRDLWISADDEDRAKDLYVRLGFRPVCTALESTLLPPA